MRRCQLVLFCLLCITREAAADDLSLLDGLWIEPSAKCSEAQAAMVFDMGGVFFEGFEPYAILIKGSSVYGIENTCQIRATKRSKRNILATMECAGEGEEYKEIARYDREKPTELVVGNTLRYKRCSSK